jgi:ABC-2 type transport system ATP-binding protein
MALIEVERLTKVYRTSRKRPGFLGALQGLFSRETAEVRAVEEVSFSIEEGELVGFLGPNGAGKTTTLKMLSGILVPTGGQARVLGFTPWDRKDAYRRQFALVMGQKNQLWWDLPAQESLYLNKEIYGVPDDDYRRILDEMTALLQVRPLLGVMVRELSLGERMKMELIAALLHRPRVLLLDEPTIGLDVVAQRNIRDFIRDYNQRTKTTILLTSHYMNDIEALCDRVLIINRGRKVFDGSLASVVEGFSASKRVTLTFDDGRLGKSDLERFGEVVEFQPHKAVLQVPRGDITRISAEILGRWKMDDISIEEVPIEDVVGAMFERGGRG